MLKNIKSDYAGWLVIIGAVVLLLEILFFNSGLIFSLFIACGMIYLGRKRKGKRLSKFLFYGGIVFLCINIFSMMTFKFLLLAILLHLSIQYFQSKKQPQKITPKFTEPEPENVQAQENIIRTKPIFQNIFLGRQKTPSDVYEWNDINIQTGIGDSIVDLSYTMLPKGETIIFIRGLIGNIQILVPYEIEVSVHHSVLAGSTKVLENQDTKQFNQVLQLKTSGYETSEQKVKIFTSMLIGNLEVSRI